MMGFVDNSMKASDHQNGKDLKVSLPHYVIHIKHKLKKSKSNYISLSRYENVHNYKVSKITVYD